MASSVICMMHHNEGVQYGSNIQEFVCRMLHMRFVVNDLLHVLCTYVRITKFSVM